jgi:hypothetical protein
MRRRPSIPYPSGWGIVRLGDERWCASLGGESDHLYLDARSPLGRLSAFFWLVGREGG